MCISSTSNCPINYLSENKLNENIKHSSVIIGSKTFDDDITQNRKIIAGLVADSDIYLNYDNEQNIIIDNYTISGLLEDNKNLFKEVDLGFDPYQTEDINEKGNSYLRIHYSEGLNLTELKTKIEKYRYHSKLNGDKIKPINKNIKVTSICGLIACGFAFLTLIFICSRVNEKNFYASLGGIFVVLMLVSLIYACINISKFRGLKKVVPNNDNIETARKLNLSFVILGFSCVPFIILFYYLFDKINCNNCCCNKSKESHTVENKTNSSTENKPKIDNVSDININK